MSGRSPLRGSGCEASPSAAISVASSLGRIPNAGDWVVVRPPKQSKDQSLYIAEVCRVIGKEFSFKNGVRRKLSGIVSIHSSIDEAAAAIKSGRAGA